MLVSSGKDRLEIQEGPLTRFRCQRKLRRGLRVQTWGIAQPESGPGEGVMKVQRWEQCPRQWGAHREGKGSEKVLTPEEAKCRCRKVLKPGRKLRTMNVILRGTEGSLRGEKRWSLGSDCHLDRVGGVQVWEGEEQWEGKVQGAVTQLVTRGTGQTPWSWERGKCQEGNLRGKSWEKEQWRSCPQENIRVFWRWKAKPRSEDHAFQVHLPGDCAWCFRWHWTSSSQTWGGRHAAQRAYCPHYWQEKQESRWWKCTVMNSNFTLKALLHLLFPNISSDWKRPWCQWQNRKTII